MKGRCIVIPIIDKKLTGVNLRRIMDERCISAKQIQKYLGLGCVQSVYRWLEGTNMPTIDNLYALSELFNVPIDKIVRGNRDFEIPAVLFKDIMESGRRLHAYFLGLTKVV